MNALARAAVTVTSSASPIGFELGGDSSWPVRQRYLTVDGKRAFETGNTCETCDFWFTRLDGANGTVDVGALAAKLSKGLQRIDRDTLNDLIPLLPASQYQVALFRFAPKLVRPGSADDYFAHEQVDYSGIDNFLGLPHYPNTFCYRPLLQPSTPVGLGKDRLFEFIIPMFPNSYLDQERVAHYVRELGSGVEPTALAIGILDIKAPVTLGEATEIEGTHWCFAHYVLDGHHKLAAAAQIGRPITILSFIAVDRSICRQEDIATVLATN